MSLIFHHNNYKKYLKSILKNTNHRGFQKKMAEAAGCQPSYLSQCLNGSVHLTEDHVFAIASFLGSSVNEQEYFLCLLRIERASNYQFKNYMKKKLVDLKRVNMTVSQAVKESKTLGPKEQAVYYSDWSYSMVHMLVGIPEYQSLITLEKKTKLSFDRLREVIKFLVKYRLVYEKDGKFSPGDRSLHLKSNSEFIIQHHVNHRLLAVDCARKKDEDNLQYSSMITISKKSADILKTEILNFIKKAKEEIKASSEEEIYCFNIDFLNL